MGTRDTEKDEKEPQINADGRRWGGTFRADRLEPVFQTVGPYLCSSAFICGFISVGTPCLGYPRQRVISVVIRNKSLCEENSQGNERDF